MFKRIESNEVTDDIFALFLKNHSKDFEKHENMLNTKCEKCGRWSWNCQCNLGPRGPRGETGATGPRGMDGATGETGAHGMDGATGSTGPRGKDGATGASGARGIDGATGAIGPTGADGATGVTGTRGPRGATGPQGLQGDTGPKGANESGYFWNTTIPDTDIAAGENIPFSDGAAHSQTINYDVCTKEIALESGGFYKVEFTVAAKNPNQVTLFLNGWAVPGGTYGIDVCNGVNYGIAYLKSPADGRLALKNHISVYDGGKIELRENPGGSSCKDLAVNASILIEKIG